MRGRLGKIALLIFSVTMLPLVVCAQDQDGYLKGLHIVLDKLYSDMMPLSRDLIDISRAISGFGAIFYIGYRVWQHMANAEAIDVFPLLRPFALAFCITMFPQVLNLINGVLKPTVTGTAAMITNSDAAMRAMLEGKKKAIMEEQKGIVGPSATDHQWEQHGVPSPSPPEDGISNPLAGISMAFGFQNMIRRFVASTLELLYESASLCINTIRTFNLVVLAILGPLVFGLSVFDGFQHILRAWLARYINIYLWLPIANIFSAMIARIQENMLILQQTQSGDSWYSSTNTGYLVFLVIAILGFWTVPSIANYIMHAGTMGSLMQRVNYHSRSLVQPVVNAWMGKLK